MKFLLGFQVAKFTGQNLLGDMFFQRGLHFEKIGSRDLESLGLRLGNCEPGESLAHRFYDRDSAWSPEIDNFFGRERLRGLGQGRDCSGHRLNFRTLGRLHFFEFFQDLGAIGPVHIAFLV